MMTGVLMLVRILDLGLKSVPPEIVQLAFVGVVEQEEEEEAEER